jgi:hypothetical protein
MHQHALLFIFLVFGPHSVASSVTLCVPVEYSLACLWYLPPLDPSCFSLCFSHVHSHMFKCH